MNQAIIYVTEDALATANAIKDLSYYDRMLLGDDEATDLSQKPGYFLKNANKLRLAALPSDAVVSLRVVPEEPVIYRRHVSMPTNLRGCIFEKAPHLPDGYAGIVTYWSGPPVNSNTSGAAYFQNKQNEYMVDLTALEAADGEPDAIAAASAVMDNLLSEGVVVCITGLEKLLADLPVVSYIEIAVPVDGSMLGVEPDDFQSEKAYALDPSQQYERVFLLVGDILLHSPDPDRIYIDLIRTELLSYGYWY